MVIKRRSPNYPNIDLQEAVRVVATLYQGSVQGRGVGRGEFTPQDAAAAWGYTSTAAAASCGVNSPLPTPRP